MTTEDYGLMLQDAETIAGRVDDFPDDGSLTPDIARAVEELQDAADALVSILREQGQKGAR